MDSMLIEILANLLILAGVLVFSVAAVGLFKFTDTYTRISAVGTAAGLGISMLVVGVFCLMPSWQNFIKLILILFLQLATSSIGTMAIARSAYLTGSTMHPGYFDHLAEDQGDPTEHAQPDDDIEERRPDQPADDDNDTTQPAT